MKLFKKVKEIVDPPMEIFFVKPEHRTFRTPREYLDENMCYSKVVPYSKVLHAIYQEVCISTDPISQGFKRLYEEAIETGNHSAKRELYRWPYVLFSDLSPEDYYLIQLGLQYNTIHPHSLTQAFLDIEMLFLIHFGSFAHFSHFNGTKTTIFASSPLLSSICVRKF